MQIIIVLIKYNISLLYYENVLKQIDQNVNKIKYKFSSFEYCFSLHK